MKNNIYLKVLLIFQTILLLTYTYQAFHNDGSDLIGIFLTNIQSFNWNGQFNLDFSCYLLLSALWIMWRNKFTPTSILIGLSAMIIGILFFAPYLLYLIFTEQGNLTKVFVGNR